MLLLYYWPTIQGRGEFVRLALEQAGAPYRDVAREDGVEAMFSAMHEGPTPAFAPPFLKDGDLVVGQVANILLHLGDRFGLAPSDAGGRLWTHQIQLTIADIVAEAHDTHHPVGNGLYYEDQKPEAARRAADFRDNRIPKFLGWLETVLARNPACPGHLVGAETTYADLSLFQLVEGLRYAFPRAAERALAQAPQVMALHGAVAELPRIRDYLQSSRRIPFSDDGIFRRYPELDG
jgi:glutathione S-transferase